MTVMGLVRGSVLRGGRFGAVVLALSALSTSIGAAGCTGWLGDGSEPGSNADPAAEVLGSPDFRRLSPIEVEQTLDDILVELGIAATAGDLLLAPPDVRYSFSNTADSGNFGTTQVQNIMTWAESVSALFVADAPAVLGCTPTPVWDECVSDFASRLGRLTFRRPLDADELATFQAVYGGAMVQPEEPTDGVRAVVELAFQSPHHWYLSNATRPDSRQLTSHAIAGRLSYYLWGSMPDAALRDAADRDELQTAEQVRAQAERLLDDSRAEVVIERFHREWLHVDSATSLSKNASIPSVIKPQLAFDTVFPNGPPDGMEPPPSVDYLSLRRRSVLDGVLQDFNRLQARVSAADRARLEAHAERIREVEQSLGAGGPGPAPVACADGLDVPLTGLDHRGVAETQIDILAYAIACNVADVGTFRVHDLEENAWGHVSHPNLAETFAGENYHGAWHRASDQGLATARAAFTAINAWYGALFARLLQKLDQIDEGEGTVLDNTMVLWACDFGHGGGHSSDNFAVVMAGNAGGAGLGRHVNYASDPTHPYGDDSQPGNHNLAVTMTNAFGIPGDTFGDYDTVIEPVEPGPLTL